MDFRGWTGLIAVVGLVLAVNGTILALYLSGRPLGEMGAPSVEVAVGGLVSIASFFIGKASQ